MPIPTRRGFKTKTTSTTLVRKSPLGPTSELKSPPYENWTSPSVAEMPLEMNSEALFRPRVRQNRDADRLGPRCCVQDGFRDPGDEDQFSDGQGQRKVGYVPTESAWW